MKAEQKSERARLAERRPDPLFERLAERTFKTILALDPIFASRIGAHGKNDGLLPDRSREGEKAALASLRSLLAEFEGFDPRLLCSEQAVDRELARGCLSARIALEERRAPGRTMPQVYVDDAMLGLRLLLLGDYAPPEVRARSLLGRLKAVPVHLRAARTNLESPAVVFTESALLACERADRLFRGSLGGFLERLDDEPLRQQCRRAAEEALRAVHEYGGFLRGTLLTRSSGDFRIGKPLFNRVLRETHRVPFDADDLVVLGERVYHETLREIRALAARIRTGYNWSRLLLELRDDHPSGRELLPAYSESVERARAFLVRRSLVGIPKGERLATMLTPEFARPFYPYAGYMPPAPLHDVQEGRFWVTAAETGESVGRREPSFRGHPRFGIPVEAVHEGYPGHHLQFVLSHRVGRKLRLLFPTPVFVEGWAHYCEEMMYREGFYNDERVRLHQLCEQLWRSCGVIADVGLHTGRLTTHEAVSLLVRKAKLDRPRAMAEVRRYCATPTEPMSHVVGKLLLQELLEDSRARRGKEFSLGAFHDEVLSYGPLPIDLIRRQMGVPQTREKRELMRSLSRAARGASPGA